MGASSSLWFAAIVGGAILVAIGNIQYQRARESEIQQALASEARAVLAPEVRGNLELVGTVEGQLAATQVPIARLQSSAWQTVSAGELVRGFRGTDLAKVAAAYESSTGLTTPLTSGQT